MRETIVADWRGIIEREVPGDREVDSSHPLRIVYGIDDLGFPRFMVITKYRPTAPSLSSSVRIDIGRRSLDKNWTLALTLLDRRLDEVFLRLCDDLARRTSHVSSERRALTELLGGVREWRNLLEPSTHGVMTHESLRGLFAELWFGFGLTWQSWTHLEVLEAWKGPMGNPQDFVFSNGDAYEVKSIHADSTYVTISSATQLDPGDLKLRLVTVRVDDVPEGATDGLNLSGLLSKIELNLDDTVSISQVLERTSKIGIDLTNQANHLPTFRLGDTHHFQVPEEFPSIRASRLPDSISDVKYHLRLSALQNFLLRD